MSFDEHIADITLLSEAENEEFLDFDGSEFNELILLRGYSTESLAQRAKVPAEFIQKAASGLAHNLDEDDKKRIASALSVKVYALDRALDLTKSMLAVKHEMRRLQKDDPQIPVTELELKKNTSDPKEEQLLRLIFSKEKESAHSSSIESKTTTLLSVLETKSAAQRLSFAALNQLDMIAATIAHRTQNNPEASILEQSDIEVLRDLSTQLRQLADALDLIRTGKEPSKSITQMGKVFGDRIKKIIRRGSEEIVEEAGYVAVISLLSGLLSVFGQTEIAAGLIAYLAGKKS